MYRKNETFTVVFNGDWNKLYIQPDWIAKHVFEQAQIEIGVMGIGTDVTISYRLNNVSILPSQSQMIFSTSSITEENIKYLCTCIGNFMKNSVTPSIVSYGFNSDYSDNGESFAKILDCIPDNSTLYELGCEIQTSRFIRSVKYDNKLYNIESSLNGEDVNVHINEHHEGEINKDELKDFDDGIIKTYFENCWKLVEAMGYEKENE